VDRVAELPEAIDVPPNRPDADLESIRELPTRPVSAGLEEREEAEEPGGRLDHIGSLPPIADRN
jgi:hypothetical protein